MIPEESLRQTYEHIILVQQLLASVQVEIMRRQFSHDRSKLVSPEWEMFRNATPNLKELTYGSPEYEDNRKLLLGQALNHHYQNNRHHPEFFENGINDMNLIDIIELVCDWVASSKRHSDGNIYKSIDINKTRFGMSDQLTQIIQNTVDILENHFVGLESQKSLHIK